MTNRSTVPRERTAMRRPAFWAYLAVLLASTWILAVQETLLRSISPSGWLLAWVLVLLYAAPLVAAGWFLGLFERGTRTLLLAALIWGVAAAGLAGLANAGWTIAIARLGGAAFASRWGAALTAPWIEESLKGCGVILLVLVTPEGSWSALSGYLTGASVGLGFAVVEDVFYSMSVFGGRPGAVFSGFLVRVVGGGLYGHIFYSGLVGLGIGYFVSDKTAGRAPRRFAVAVGCFLVAVMAHLLWNSPLLNQFPVATPGFADALGSLGSICVEALPLLALAVLGRALIRARERAWFAGARGEIGEGGFTAEEYEVVRDPRSRRLSRRLMRARAGRSAEKLLDRLQHEQFRLARMRSRAPASDPRVRELRRYCASLRSALDAMPGAAAASASLPSVIPAPFDDGSEAGSSEEGSGLPSGG